MGNTEGKVLPDVDVDNEPNDFLVGGVVVTSCRLFLEDFGSCFLGDVKSATAFSQEDFKWKQMEGTDLAVADTADRWTDSAGVQVVYVALLALVLALALALAEVLKLASD